MNLEYFNIFPNEKTKDTQPDYNISAKVNDKYETVGACWKKVNEKGHYLSCKVDGVRQKTEKNANGTEKNPNWKAPEPVEDIGGIDYPDEGINPEDIPF